MFKRLKRWFNKYLEDMAKENQATFGKGKIDCCDLNRNSNNTNKNNGK